MWGSGLTEVDPWMAALLEREEVRQLRQICLGAASSLCPAAVREAQASVFSNIDAEGYPPKRMVQADWKQLLNLDEQVAYYFRYGDSRYNKGTELANVVEVVAQRRAAGLFATEWADNSDISVNASDIHVNLQCPTGSLANTAVFEALLKPGDVVLSMNLVDGGHLTHGSPLHRSGRTYNIVHYGVDAVTQRLNYDSIRDLAQQHRPKLIVGGASSYPWAIDWKMLRQIAEEIEPRPSILADISHPAGLVSAGLIPNPIGYADVVTFTTYKTLCGPRGAAILCTDAMIAEAINRAVFPGLQSAPVFQQIVALAVAFEIARTAKFRRLQRKIAENARLLHLHLTQLEIPVAFGGTNTHIVVADVGKVPTSTKQRLCGDVVARILERAGISCNSNMIPGDRYAALASGIRLGTTWISQLGYGEAEVCEIATIIAEICNGIKPYSFYGTKRETRGGKVNEDLFRSASRRVREILQNGGEYVPDVLLEKRYKDSNQAKAKQALPAADKIKIWDLRSQSEALIVMGERAPSFLQSIVTRDMYELKQGEVIPALVLHPNGEKRLNVFVCALSGTPCPRYLLVYPCDPETRFRDWLQMLSDGHVEVESDDPSITIDGPVVIKEADSWHFDHIRTEIDNVVEALADFATVSEADGESLIDSNKPYFIGQAALPKDTQTNKQWFSFEGMDSSMVAATSMAVLASENPSKPSPFYNCHKALGATFTDFAGYLMPLYYTSNSQEHQRVRTHAGLFDLSYKVLLAFQGHGAERFLDIVLTEYIPALNIGESCRACILCPEGMVISDCVLYRTAADYFIMELEPVNAQAVESWLRAVAAREVMIDLAKPGVEVDRSCSITNFKTCSEPLLVLALQGQKSTAILQRLLNNDKSRIILNNLRRGHIAELSISGIIVRLARRGYTGELIGYEIFVPESQAGLLWNAILDAGFDFSLRPTGLSAAESLRIEAGLPLCGRELGGPYAVSPTEAGFGSCIKLHKPFFIGRQHMISCLPSRRLVRLRAEMDTANLEILEPIIYDEARNIIGVMTSSACVSGQYYGIGLLDEKLFDKGNVYLSCDGMSLRVEVLPVPYASVVGA
jgi:glycine hydroxymethyltransferase